MLSVDSGHGDTARTLLEAGAKPGVINKDGQTAADLAAGSTEMDSVLKKMEMDHLIDTFRDQNIDFEG